MPSYFISGASRGLGLEFARQLLAGDKTAHVVAAARNPGTATELQALIKANPDRLVAVKVDVSDVESVKKGVAEATKIPFLKSGLDVLINNAGIITEGWKAPSQSTLAGLQTDLMTNLFGVIALTTELLPLLRAGNGKRIFTVSSLLGSLGGDLSKLPVSSNYSISKAALNMYSLKLARELDSEGFTVVPFHPGYVRTDMNGGLDGPGEITKEESVEKSLKTLLGTTKANNGDFFNYTGEKLAW